MSAPRKVLVCVNYRANPSQPSCAARGSEAIACALEAAVEQQKLEISVERFNCLGQCESGPNVRLTPAGRGYHGVGLQDVPQVMSGVEEFCKR